MSNSCGQYGGKLHAGSLCKLDDASYVSLVFRNLFFQEKDGIVPVPATLEQIAEYAKTYPDLVRPEDAEAKDVLVFFPEGNKAPDVVTGVAPEIVSLTRLLAGTPIINCTSDGMSHNYSLLYSTWGGKTTVWDKSSLERLRGLFDQPSVSAGYCMNDKLSTDSSHLTVGVNFSTENFTNVNGAVKRLNESCVGLDEVHCATARETLNASFRMYYKMEPPGAPKHEAGLWDKVKEFWPLALLFGIQGPVQVYHLIKWIVNRNRKDPPDKPTSGGVDAEAVKTVLLALLAAMAAAKPENTPPPEAPPQNHQVGLEVPALLGAAVVVEAAPSLWSSFWATMGALGEGALSAATRVTVPIVIIPDDDPYFGEPDPYWGPQPSRQVWY